MKIIPRLFWVFTIFLFIAELIIFRQAISYHTSNDIPASLIADNYSMPVNRYVSLPTALQATPPLVIKAPGYKIHVYQHLKNNRIFIYDLDSRLSAQLKKMPESTLVEGRLLQLKDAPFSSEILRHFTADDDTPAYALLLNVKPRKNTFYLYLAAILLSILLIAVYPFLGKAGKKKIQLTNFSD